MDFKGTLKCDYCGGTIEYWASPLAWLWWKIFHRYPSCNIFRLSWRKDKDSYFICPWCWENKVQPFLLKEADDG